MSKVFSLTLFIANVKRSFVSFFSNKENHQVALLMFAIAFLFIAPDVAYAATNPVAAMKQVFIEQAETNAFPVIIIWILIFGVVTAFFMGKFYPFILAVFACGVVAIAPEVAPSFNSTNIAPTTGW